MRTVMCHDGKLFRVEKSTLRETLVIVQKASGRCAVLRGVSLVKLYDAIDQYCNKHGSFENDGDALYSWIWTNAGFHRYA